MESLSNLNSSEMRLFNIGKTDFRVICHVSYLEGGLLREDVEYLLCFIRVFPGSLSDISFRTACGLSVPANKPCFKPSASL